MSYCSRCFAIFFGLAIGAAITTFIVFELKWWLILLGIIPIGLDGGLQLITTYESNNVFRLFTGGLFGAITTIAVGIVIVELSQSGKYWLTNKIWYKNYMKKYPKKISEPTKEINIKWRLNSATFRILRLSVVTRASHSCRHYYFLVSSLYSSVIIFKSLITVSLMSVIFLI